MNPASLNYICALMEEVRESKFADEVIKSIIQNSITDTVLHLERVLNGL